MPSLVSLILIVLCYPMHACYVSARPLGLFGKYSCWSVQLHIKVLEVHDSKEKHHHEASVPSTLGSFVSKEDQAPQRDKNGTAELIVKSSYVVPKEEDSKIGALGTEVAISLLKKGMDEAIKIKDVKRQGRLMLGDAHEDTKDSVDANDSEENMEDISEMDYAQPHRKPPIHNENLP